MSRARIEMVCILATLLVLSVGCSAQAPKVIAQKLCDQVDQAMANHDLNQILGFYDSTYVYIDAQGNRWPFAESRKNLEWWFLRARDINSSTRIQDVKLEAGRMVVYSKNETHYEFHDERLGWVPKIVKTSGVDSWERKGGQWKLVLSKTLHADMGVDAESMASEKDQKAIEDHVENCLWIETACNVNCRVAWSTPTDLNRCYEHCKFSRLACVGPTICNTDLQRSYPLACGQ